MWWVEGSASLDLPLMVRNDKCVWFRRVLLPVISMSVTNYSILSEYWYELKVEPIDNSFKVLRFATPLGRLSEKTVCRKVVGNFSALIFPGLWLSSLVISSYLAVAEILTPQMLSFCHLLHLSSWPLVVHWYSTSFQVAIPISDDFSVRLPSLPLKL